MTDLATVPVEGCFHCGVAKREHVQRWHPSVGFHGWTEPTRSQIRERMRKNRGLACTDRRPR